PAALRIGLVGVPEAFRRRDAAVGIALAALDIADPVQRLQHLLAELRCLAEDRLDHVGRGVGEARQGVVALDVENGLEQEEGVFHRGLVGRHVGLSPKKGLEKRLAASARDSRPRGNPARRGHAGSTRWFTYKPSPGKSNTREGGMPSKGCRNLAAKRG